MIFALLWIIPTLIIKKRNKQCVAIKYALKLLNIQIYAAHTKKSALYCGFAVVVTTMTKRWLRCSREKHTENHENPWLAETADWL